MRRKIHFVGTYLSHLHLGTTQSQPQSKMERKCMWSKKLNMFHCEYFSYYSRINIGSEWINNLEIAILRKFICFNLFHCANNVSGDSLQKLWRKPNIFISFAWESRTRGLFDSWIHWSLLCGHHALNKLKKSHLSCNAEAKIKPQCLILLVVILWCLLCVLCSKMT